MRIEGIAFIEKLMDELRTLHLDQPAHQSDRPRPSERLEAARAAVAGEARAIPKDPPRRGS